jgi:hypothetical protein
MALTSTALGVICFVLFLPLIVVTAVGIPVGLFAEGRWQLSCPLIGLSLVVYYLTDSVLWGFLTFLGVPFTLFYVFTMLILIAM